MLNLVLEENGLKKFADITFTIFYYFFFINLHGLIFKRSAMMFRGKNESTAFYYRL